MVNTLSFLGTFKSFVMLSDHEIVIRLLLASLLGGLIGLERERKHWAAGLRTHMMVCVGSCLIMIVSAYGFEDILNREHVGLDPSRVAAQVVSGIGFIGAGTILFLKQGTIRGLTTASGLWTVAAIGLATGGGLYFAAGMTTAIALIILWAIQPLEKIYTKRFESLNLRIVANKNIDSKEFVKNLFDLEQIKVQSFSMEKEEHNLIIQVLINVADKDKLYQILDRIKNMQEISEVSLGK